jgi:hypothetical protein
MLDGALGRRSRQGKCRVTWAIVPGEAAKRKQDVLVELCPRARPTQSRVVSCSWLVKREYTEAEEAPCPPVDSSAKGDKVDPVAKQMAQMAQMASYLAYSRSSARFALVRTSLRGSRSSGPGSRPRAAWLMNFWLVTSIGLVDVTSICQLRADIKAGPPPPPMSPEFVPTVAAVLLCARSAPGEGFHCSHVARFKKMLGQASRASARECRSYWGREGRSSSRGHHQAADRFPRTSKGRGGCTAPSILSRNS